MKWLNPSVMSILHGLLLGNWRMRPRWNLKEKMNLFLCLINFNQKYVLGLNGFHMFRCGKTFFFHKIRSNSAQEIIDPGALCQILPDEVFAFAYYSCFAFFFTLFLGQMRFSWWCFYCLLSTCCEKVSWSYVPKQFQNPSIWKLTKLVQSANVLETNAEARRNVRNVMRTKMRLLTMQAKCHWVPCMALQVDISTMKSAYKLYQRHFHVPSGHYSAHPRPCLDQI